MPTGSAVKEWGAHVQMIFNRRASMKKRVRGHSSATTPWYFCEWTFAIGLKNRVKIHLREILHYGGIGELSRFPPVHPTMISGQSASIRKIKLPYQRKDKIQKRELSRNFPQNLLSRSPSPIKVICHLPRILKLAPNSPKKNEERRDLLMSQKLLLAAFLASSDDDRVLATFQNCVVCARGVDVGRRTEMLMLLQNSISEPTRRQFRRERKFPETDNFVLL
ncbi:hypothetical protein CEXT_752031 [Caerostris extrusa]|uniref:Uncharacterized protein n=1 Tax=Caerostris extrusa TaxID=172846 RepID=A0AAV4YAD7_CAEEX|nr:hypothetical protein CEXT_752031 [Caerostris extrusa]